VQAIQSALVSVHNKDGLEPVIERLNQLGVRLYASGGTADYIRSLDVMCEDLSEVTGFPSILGGRVKTLHPRIFGGILAERASQSHKADVEQHGITFFDLVIVDLYPFELTLRKTDDVPTLIEKIDIGGVSLIRAAAKNFKDVLVLPSAAYYADLLGILDAQGANITAAQRAHFAREAFYLTQHYDEQIARFFDRVAAESAAAEADTPALPSRLGRLPLRYGENPHQPGFFVGGLAELLTQHAGKALSYNNILDADSALRLIADFQDSPATVAIIKHTNPCGVASRSTLALAWDAALASDPVSAFGGVIVTNQPVDAETAQRINKLFYEVLLAPGFDADALDILRQKEGRILCTYRHLDLPGHVVRTALNGQLVQAADRLALVPDMLRPLTARTATPAELADAVFGLKVAKHLKSNAIAIVKDGQLIGEGTGQTSRIDALQQALAKANRFGFDLKGAVLASDGFFPFADSVQTAHLAGIDVIVEPGGSKKDQDTIDYCTQNNLCLMFSDSRHFKH